MTTTMKQRHRTATALVKRSESSEKGRSREEHDKELEMVLTWFKWNTRKEEIEKVLLEIEKEYGINVKDKLDHTSHARRRTSYVPNSSKSTVRTHSQTLARCNSQLFADRGSA